MITHVSEHISTPWRPREPGEAVCGSLSGLEVREHRGREVPTAKLKIPPPSPLWRTVPLTLPGLREQWGEEAPCEGDVLVFIYSGDGLNGERSFLLRVLERLDGDPVPLSEVERPVF